MATKGGSMTMKLALDLVMALAILSMLLILTLLIVLKDMRVRLLGRRARYVLVLVCIIVGLLTMGVACEPEEPVTPDGGGGGPPPQPTVCGKPAITPINPITGQPEEDATVCTSP